MSAYNDAVYGDTLVLIASGEARQDSSEILGDKFGMKLTVGEIEREMNAALTDALKQGIEREDIDPSWFAS